MKKLQSAVKKDFINPEDYKKYRKNLKKWRKVSKNPWK